MGIMFTTSPNFVDKQKCKQSLSELTHAVKMSSCGHVLLLLMLYINTGAYECVGRFI